MTSRVATAALVTVWLVFVLSSIALGLLQVDLGTPLTLAEFLLVLVPNTLLIVCGTIIVLRSDVRIIGWLLALPGALFAVLYSLEALQAQTDAAWIDVVLSLGLLSLLPMFLLVLVFPSGRLPNRTARWLAWTFSVLVVGTSLVDLVVHVVGVPVGEEAVFTVFTFALLPLALIMLVNHVRLYSRRPREQQRQLKWFVLAITGVLVYPVVIGLDLSDTTWFYVADAISTSAWPIAILIAIQRHRLYDIDRIVSRTVTYALVAGVLGITYAGGVALATRLLPAQTDLAVAASTVAVATLFNPLRIRLRDLVDRRFNRTRYVARRVVEQFGRNVAQETDLDRFSENMIEVIMATVAPATVAVWQPSVSQDAHTRGEPRSKRQVPGALAATAPGRVPRRDGHDQGPVSDTRA